MPTCPPVASDERRPQSAPAGAVSSGAEGIIGSTAPQLFELQDRAQAAPPLQSARPMRQTGRRRPCSAARQCRRSPRQASARCKTPTGGRCSPTPTGARAAASPEGCPLVDRSTIGMFRALPWWHVQAQIQRTSRRAKERESEAPPPPCVGSKAAGPD